MQIANIKPPTPPSPPTNDRLLSDAMRAGKSIAALIKLAQSLGYQPKPSLEAMLDQLSEGDRFRLSAKLNTNECYTSGKIIAFARDVFGGDIDLDVASNPIANEIIQAKQFYTWKENGLLQPWTGNIWCNPPFSAALIKGFAEKMVNSRSSYNQGLFLCNVSMNSSWNQLLQTNCDAVLFPHGRLQFWGEHSPEESRENPDGNNMYQQCMFYFGGNVDRFSTLGNKFGTVFSRISN
jgi:hypothetical protein